jgi:hypothetical protein
MPVLENPAMEPVVFGVLHPCFHLTLILRRVSLTSMNAKTGCCGIGVKCLAQLQLPILLMQHHQLGLIADAFLGPPANK